MRGILTAGKKNFTTVGLIFDKGNNINEYLPPSRLANQHLLLSTASIPRTAPSLSVNATRSIDGRQYQGNDTT